MSTVLAPFRDQGETEAAVDALRSAHFESARLGLVHVGDAKVPRYGQNALVGVVSVYSEPDKVEEARRILLEEGAFEAAPIDAPMRKAS